MYIALNYEVQVIFNMDKKYACNRSHHINYKKLRCQILICVYLFWCKQVFFKNLNIIIIYNVKMQSDHKCPDIAH